MHLFLHPSFPLLTCRLLLSLVVVACSLLSLGVAWCRLVSLVATCCHLVSLVVACCHLYPLVIACCLLPRAFAWCRLLPLLCHLLSLFACCRLRLVNAYHLLLLVACCFCLSLLAILPSLSSHVLFFPVTFISHLLSLVSHLLSLVAPHQSLISLVIRPLVTRLFFHLSSFFSRLLPRSTLLQILGEAWSEM
jgi:hypothetical protein